LLHKLFLAFSRDKQATGDGQTPSKRYVQHLLYESADLIWDLVYRRNGVVYVCGGTSMGAAIRDTIVRIAEEIGNMSHERAKEYLAEMQAKHRYVAELWS
jgi:sulfite reductase alpha subunit-like flavoprotein